VTIEIDDVLFAPSPRLGRQQSGNRIRLERDAERRIPASTQHNAVNGQLLDTRSKQGMLFRNLKAEFLRHRDLRPDDRKDMILKIFDDILETDSRSLQNRQQNGFATGGKS
jgi:hypothetical protein